MNQKSFWRGFGVGVLFTAVILGISCIIRTSDSQVVSRAKKLGMVYAKDAGNTKVAQSDATEAPTDSEEKKPTEPPQATKESVSTEKPKASADVAAPTPEKEDETAKATKAPAKDNAGSQDQSIKDEEKKLKDEKDKMEKDMKQTTKNLEIKVGEWSSDVSKHLASMGIIKNATDFDKYLNDHGYSGSISAGTYQVSPDDTYQELAKKITRRR